MCNRLTKAKQIVMASDTGSAERSCPTATSTSGFTRTDSGTAVGFTSSKTAPNTAAVIGTVWRTAKGSCVIRTSPDTKVRGTRCLYGDCCRPSSNRASACRHRRVLFRRLLVGQQKRRPRRFQIRERRHVFGHMEVRHEVRSGNVYVLQDRSGFERNVVAQQENRQFQNFLPHVGGVGIHVLRHVGRRRIGQRTIPNNKRVYG